MTLGEAKSEIDHVRQIRATTLRLATPQAPSQKRRSSRYGGPSFLLPFAMMSCAQAQDRVAGVNLE
jgi:hypothetical protein